MPKLLVLAAITLFALAMVAFLYSGLALAADGAGGGSEVTGWLGGTAGVGGLSIVGYLLIRYLPKRDEDLMGALKEKDMALMTSFDKKDEAVMKALKEKDEMWSKLLERNDERWQAAVGALTEELQALKGTNGKLREAILHSLQKPGMTSLGVKAVVDSD